MISVTAVAPRPLWHDIYDSYKLCVRHICEYFRPKSLEICMEVNGNPLLFLCLNGPIYFNFFHQFLYNINFN